MGFPHPIEELPPEDTLPEPLTISAWYPIWSKEHALHPELSTLPQLRFRSSPT